MSDPGVASGGGRAWPIAVSAVAHALVIAAVGVVAYRIADQRAAEELREAAAPAGEVTIELPVFAASSLAVDHADVPEGEVPSAHGGATIARADTGQAGHGGSPSTDRATNLADADDGLRLAPDLVSHLARDQHQRLRTADARATREDRRATTNPMELTFLASGAFERQERRPVANVDPSRGSLAAPRPAVRGGAPGSATVSDDDGGEASGVAHEGAARAGGVRSSPGGGVRDGEEGRHHRAAARVASGRPSVAEGPVAIPAVVRARPNDTMESDQEVANTVRSLVHASVLGGVAGAGRGGTPSAEPVPGAGASSGRGSVARPLGAGDGDVFDWYTSDPELLPYFRRLHAKVDPLWRDAFPRSAMLELKQGTVILELTIAADGSAKVSWPPVRPSGIDEFDRNCAEALRRASPFDPIPRSLGRPTLRIRAPFVAKNPIIK